MKKLGLLPKVFIAIILGIAISYILPEWAARIFVTISSLFNNLLELFIPFLIIGLVAPAIGELGNGAGRLPLPLYQSPWPRLSRTECAKRLQISLSPFAQPFICLVAY